MKKSKKLGLQSLALVLMSLVLVAGVAFGMTGAWFQDSDSVADQTVTMGHSVTLSLSDVSGTGYVGIEKKAGEGKLTAAMPGDTYHYSGLQVNIPANQSAMYVIAKVGVGDSDLFTGVQLASGWIAFTGEGATGWVYRVVEADDEAQTFALLNAQDWVLAHSLTNAEAGKSIKITGAVCAIQKANVTITAETTLAQLNAYFAETANNDIVLDANGLVDQTPADPEGE